jgi:IS30 family transposase
MLEWRRNKVQQLLVRGYSQWDIADELQIDQSTVSRDIQCIRREAQENLKSHIQQRPPEEYERCLTGLNQVLRLSWDIADRTKNASNDNGQTITTTDDKTRLQALSLINDCYKYIMDLTTNGVVVTDAIKYVEGKMDHLNNQEKKLFQDIKQDKKEEEEVGLQDKDTANGVF